MQTRLHKMHIILFGDILKCVLYHGKIYVSHETNEQFTASKMKKELFSKTLVYLTVIMHA